MARSHRFHLDQGGHSVTLETASGHVELLVDGKVVGSQRRRSKGATVLAAELPGDPPQPFTVRVDRSKGAGNVPVCLMEADGAREVMPYAPLAARRALSRGAGVPVHPVGWLWRLVRRRLRHMPVSRR
ncbi:hypothetical protein [Streptomyces sp. PSKA30]|uniref:hypothetical protein n=1 Tax=Streptomyces sp. PSKA30 TaxID=2874597 RepID=UPI001CD0B5E2|nr:hypothetical protein [Streptomyces sp. PSKA30]MBZ9643131.1 hypothetical protein [Streptomyces sp. PSKA30]